jgi:hypothetical protein
MMRMQQQGQEDKQTLQILKKISVFWNVIPCNQVEVYRRLGGIYCLHLQGQRVSQAINACRLPISCITYFLILQMGA